MAFNSSLLANANANTMAMPLGIGAVPPNETVIEINTETRTIEIPKKMKNLGVNGDHLSETIYFRTPRFFDNKDFSTHDCKVRWLNANNEYGESDVINIDVNDDYITFGWFITNLITRYTGDIQFTVQFETVINGIEYQWQTTPAVFTILKGIDESDIDPTGGDDTVYRQIMNAIQNLTMQVNSMSNVNNELDDLRAQVADLEARVKYLEDNAVMAIDNV